jgi:hypothetical protein
VGHVFAGAGEGRSEASGDGNLLQSGRPIGVVIWERDLVLEFVTVQASKLFSRNGGASFDGTYYQTRVGGRGLDTTALTTSSGTGRYGTPDCVLTTSEDHHPAIRPKLALVQTA